MVQYIFVADVEQLALRLGRTLDRDVVVLVDLVHYFHVHLMRVLLHQSERDRDALRTDFDVQHFRQQLPRQGLGGLGHLELRSDQLPELRGDLHHFRQQAGQGVLGELTGHQLQQESVVRLVIAEGLVCLRQGEESLVPRIH